MSKKDKQLEKILNSDLGWDKWIDDMYLDKLKVLNVEDEFIQRIENEVYNACRVPEELLKESSNTSAATAKFQIEDFEKVMDKVKKLPPICISLEVYPEGYNAIKDNVIDMNMFKEELHNRDKYSDKTEYPCPYDDIKIIVVYDNENFKYNQGRFIFNDGSTKIIDIFDREERYDG